MLRRRHSSPLFTCGTNLLVLLIESVKRVTYFYISTQSMKSVHFCKNLVVMCSGFSGHGSSHWPQYKYVLGCTAVPKYLIYYLCCSSSCMRCKRITTIFFWIVAGPFWDVRFSAAYWVTIDVAIGKVEVVFSLQVLQILHLAGEIRWASFNQSSEIRKSRLTN